MYFIIVVRCLLCNIVVGVVAKNWRIRKFVGLKPILKRVLLHNWRRSMKWMTIPCRVVSHCICYWSWGLGGTSILEGAIFIVRRWCKWEVLGELLVAWWRLISSVKLTPTLISAQTWGVVLDRARVIKGATMRLKGLVKFRLHKPDLIGRDVLARSTPWRSYSSGAHRL